MLYNETTMAKIIIKMYATIREKFKEEKVNIVASTVLEAVRKLVEEYPVLRDEVLDENLNLKNDYIYLLNGRNVEFLQKGDTPLKDGDKISIFPPVAGG
jgi:molybdopterin synthase sulfur carrier subunit